MAEKSSLVWPGKAEVFSQLCLMAPAAGGDSRGAVAFPPKRNPWSPTARLMHIHAGETSVSVASNELTTSSDHAHKKSCLATGFINDSWTARVQRRFTKIETISHSIFRCSPRAKARQGKAMHLLGRPAPISKFTPRARTCQLQSFAS